MVATASDQDPRVVQHIQINTTAIQRAYANIKKNDPQHPLAWSAWLKEIMANLEEGAAGQVISTSKPTMATVKLLHPQTSPKVQAERYDDAIREFNNMNKSLLGIAHATILLAGSRETATREFTNKAFSNQNGEALLQWAQEFASQTTNEFEHANRAIAYNSAVLTAETAAHVPHGEACNARWQAWGAIPANAKNNLANFFTHVYETSDRATPSPEEMPTLRLWMADEVSKTSTQKATPDDVAIAYYHFTDADSIRKLCMQSTPSMHATQEGTLESESPALAPKMKNALDTIAPMLDHVADAATSPARIHSTVNHLGVEAIRAIHKSHEVSRDGGNDCSNCATRKSYDVSQRYGGDSGDDYDEPTRCSAPEGNNNKWECATGGGYYDVGPDGKLFHNYKRGHDSGLGRKGRNDGHGADGGKIMSDPSGAWGWGADWSSSTPLKTSHHPYDTEDENMPKYDSRRGRWGDHAKFLSRLEPPHRQLARRLAWALAASDLAICRRAHLWNKSKNFKNPAPRNYEGWVQMEELRNFSDDHPMAATMKQFTNLANAHDLILRRGNSSQTKYKDQRAATTALAREIAHDLSQTIKPGREMITIVYWATLKALVLQDDQDQEDGPILYSDWNTSGEPDDDDVSTADGKRPRKKPRTAQAGSSR
jgi:hypothetical protein